jgi:hypothetical protein
MTFPHAGPGGTETRQTGHVSVTDAADQIRSAHDVLPSDSLRFFGEWLGGRRDNFHRIVNAEAALEDDALVVYFDAAETLMIWDPVGITANSRTFRIEDASRLVWRWFYYGRSPIPENLHRIEYVRTPDGRVRVVRDLVADVLAEPERVLEVARETPAVEMTSFIDT